MDWQHLSWPSVTSSGINVIFCLIYYTERENIQQTEVQHFLGGVIYNDITLAVCRDVTTPKNDS